MGDERVEAGGDATGNFDPGGFLLDLCGVATVIFGDGLCGGEVFPFEELPFEIVFIMARLEVGARWFDDAVFDDAAADAGGQS